MSNRGASGNCRASHYDYMIKLLLIGDSSAKKWSLLRDYSVDSFTSSFFTKTNVDFKIMSIMCDDSKVKLQVWDTERFQTITSTFYRGAMGILVVYSVTDRASFSNVRTWMREIDQHGVANVTRVLVGNNYDYEVDSSERKVTYEQGAALAKEYGIRFFETNAKSNDNVEECFLSITKEIVEHLKINPNHYELKEIDTLSSSLSPAERTAAECAALQKECDTLAEQVEKAPPCKAFVLRFVALQAQLYAAKPNYEEISALGEALETAQLSMSEDDYFTLADRHAALVKRVEAKCEELIEADLPELLESLADKLTMLQGLNVAEVTIPKDKFPAIDDDLYTILYESDKLEKLQEECAEFTAQVALIPTRGALTQLNQELQAVRAAKPVDYKQVSKLMLKRKELEAQAQLSEEDYLSLPARHAALVQQVQGMCEDLVAARQYRLLRDLAAQLIALRALDLSALSSTSKVSGDAPATNVSAAVVVAEDDGDSANDPVWVENP